MAARGSHFAFCGEAVFAGGEAGLPAGLAPPAALAPAAGLAPPAEGLAPAAGLAAIVAGVLLPAFMPSLPSAF